MTQVIDQKANEKDAKAAAIKARTAEMEKREKALNEGKTGKGLRTFLGLTRGKNPQEIRYEGFDESLPETLPATWDEFLSLTGIKDEKTVLGFLIDGFNSAAYSAASDPVSEYVEASWPEDIQVRFKRTVKDFAALNEMSIEDAVALVKPGTVAYVAKLQAK